MSAASRSSDATLTALARAVQFLTGHDILDGLRLECDAERTEAAVDVRLYDEVLGSLLENRCGLGVRLDPTLQAVEPILHLEDLFSDLLVGSECFVYLVLYGEEVLVGPFRLGELTVGFLLALGCSARNQNGTEQEHRCDQEESTAKGATGLHKAVRLYCSCGNANPMAVGRR